MRKFLSNHKLILFIAFMVPGFFVGGPGYESSRSSKDVWSLGRVLLFAVFAVAVGRAICKKTFDNKQWSISI